MESKSFAFFGFPARSAAAKPQNVSAPGANSISTCKFVRRSESRPRPKFPHSLSAFRKGPSSSRTVLGGDAHVGQTSTRLQGQKGSRREKPHLHLGGGDSSSPLPTFPFHRIFDEEEEEEEYKRSLAKAHPSSHMALFSSSCHDRSLIANAFLPLPHSLLPLISPPAGCRLSSSTRTPNERTPPSARFPKLLLQRRLLLEDLASERA